MNKEGEERKVAMELIDVLDPQREQVFLCIGTMKAEFDSIAPRIGSVLKTKGYNVIGTEENQIHALTLEDILSDLDALDKDKFQVIGIDAALCLHEDADYVIRELPIYPGCGAGKNLTPVGECKLLINTRKPLDLPMNHSEAIYEELIREDKGESRVDILTELRDKMVLYIEKNMALMKEKQCLGA